MVSCFVVISFKGHKHVDFFKEIEGNPQQVSIQTITIEAIYGNANEGSILELSCQGGHIIS